jgi:DNA replication initiation complex subunit (GINS family)
MIFLPLNVVLDIVRPELTAQQRRTARRTLRKIAAIRVIVINDSARVQLAPYIDKTLTTVEEDVALSIEDILKRNVDRLVEAIDAVEKREGV